MVFKPAFVILYTSDGQLSPPFQTSITVSGRTWGMRETEGEEERGEKRRRMEGRWRKRRMKGRKRRKRRGRM